MTNDTSPTYRTDEQLVAILHETSNWVIHGRPGFALGHGASLHDALKKSLMIAQSGATLSALTRLPMDNIIVFPPQIERLRGWVTAWEKPLTKSMTRA